MDIVCLDRVGRECWVRIPGEAFFSVVFFSRKNVVDSNITMILIIIKRVTGRF